MKVNFKTFCISILIAVFAFTFFNCSKKEEKAKGDDPITLAKMSFDLHKEALNVLFDFSKISEIDKKNKELDSRIEKLSESDKKIYEDEYNRLIFESTGSFFSFLGDTLKSYSANDDFNKNSQVFDYHKSYEEALKMLDMSGELLDSTGTFLDSTADYLRSLNDLMGNQLEKN